jgi:hypothetical protein
MASLTLWQQSEVVRKKKFPIWALKKYNVLTDLINKGEVEKIGERDFRIPFQKTFGGRVGAFDLQMGDMGRGSQPTGDKMIGSFFSTRLNFELDMLGIEATSDKKIALTDPFKDSVARGFYEFQLYLDKFYHSDGTALLATATAHSAGTGVSVYTLDTLFGAQRLRRGQYVNVYAASITTLKSAGVLYVTGINTQARTVTLSGIVPGAAATDTLTFEGVSGNSPTGLRGLYYWISSATSGTTAGINRALEPEIIANSVDGSSTGPTAEAVLALTDRMLMRRGEAPTGLMGITSTAQRAVVFSNVMSIQNYDLAKSSAQAVDRLPSLKGRKTFMWGDTPHMVDIHQDASRNDYFDPSEFGRARMCEMKFFQTPGTSQRFFPLYGGSGAPAAGVWFGLINSEDLYHVNPGNTGVLSGLPRTGFYA